MKENKRREATDLAFNKLASVSDEIELGDREFFTGGIITALGVMRALVKEIREDKSLKSKEDAMNEIEWEIFSWANEYTHEFDRKENKDGNGE